MSNWKEMFVCLFNSVSFCDFLDPVTLQFRSLNFALTFHKKTNMIKNTTETISTKTHWWRPFEPLTHVWYHWGAAYMTYIEVVWYMRPCSITPVSGLLSVLYTADAYCFLLQSPSSGERCLQWAHIYWPQWKHSISITLTIKKFC